MDYMFPSRNNEILLVNSEKITGVENINSIQEEEQPMFLQFPSPFHDDMDTTTILPILHHHHISTERCTTTAINSLNNPLKLINTTTVVPLPSKVKSVRKRKIAAKKDRHTKIHTAQGLRDRRMRLSVHTARKFFDLNDMLGFDKASKTIEWLFAKSRKAIEEVTESLESDDATLTVIEENVDYCQSHISGCETKSVMEIQSDHEINHESSKKPMESYPLVNFQQPQLGFVENKDNQNIKESSCFPLDYSNIYHFVKHLHLDNNMRNTDAFLGNNATMSSTDCSIFDYNKSISEPPAGWLNSRNTFLGFFGGWDSENSRMESNSRIVPTPLTGNVNGENPCLGIISTSNFANFHSQNQAQND